MNAFAQNLFELSNATDQKNQVAVVDARSQRTWTWEQLHRLVNQASAWLAKQDVRAGQSIVVVLPNSVETLALFYACAFSGIRFVPAPVNCQQELLATLVGAVNAKLVVTTQFMLAGQSKTLDALSRDRDVQRVTLNPDGRFDWLADIGPITTAPAEAPDGQLIITTSGTTSAPKMVQWNVSNLVQTAKSIADCYPMADHRDVFFNSFSMSYLGGFLNGALVPFVVGATTVITEPLSGRTSQTLWHDLNRFGVTVLWQPPSVLEQLVDEALSHGEILYSDFDQQIKLVLTGMAPVSQTLKDNFEQQFGVPLFENYALSETGFLTAERPERSANRLPGSVGSLIDGVELDFVVPDERDSTAAADGDRELRFKTPCMADGYLQADGSLMDHRDDDGFVATGDRGHLTDDGQLVLTGRLRDIAKRGDLLIQLNEIEFITERHPEVLAAAAVRTDHRLLGESYNLYIQTRDDSETSVKDVICTWLRRVIESDKYPTRVTFVDRFERTSAGKIVKQPLLKL